MRLRLFDRIRRLVRPRRSEAVGPVPPGRHRRDQRRGSAPGPPPDREEPLGPGQWPGTSGTLTRAAATPPDGWPAPDTSFVPDPQPVPARRASGSPAVRVGGARARVREAPPEAAAAPSPAPPPNRHAERSAELAHEEEADSRAAALTSAAVGIPQQAGRPAWRAAQARLRAKLPFVDAHPRGRPRSADGRRNCGSLETILWRQWDAARLPPPETVEAIDRLAELPEQIKARLAAGLDWIFVGPGGVPELDEMTALRGVRLPSGQATWDACAGAYGERKVVVGSQPSPTPDVMCHEIGHALDDLDSPPGKWQSDSAEFRVLYDQCQPHLASDFHRQPGGLGRKEFFADAFAAIASGQRPALVDMLSGDTRTALRVMLYFNRRYGI
jgi:hypothetical protein